MISILLIDNEPIFISSMIRKLRSKGYLDVVGVTDAKKGAAAMQAKRYDAVILDLDLPYRAGFDLLTSICSSDDAPRCIVIGSDESLAAKKTVFNAGACDFLVKPIHPNTLVEALEAVLAV